VSELATKFVALRNKLGQDDEPQASSDPAWNHSSNQRLEAGEEFDKLMNKIGDQPEFVDFLLPQQNHKSCWPQTLVQ
jgi:hypothetical protein